MTTFGQEEVENFTCNLLNRIFLLEDDKQRYVATLLTKQGVKLKGKDRRLVDF